MTAVSNLQRESRQTRWLRRLFPLLLAAGHVTAHGEVANHALRTDIAPFHVGVESRARLQALLDQHRSILLDANRDYRSELLPQLRVARGMRIAGGWNTRVPPMTIVAGASDVVIEDVRSDAKQGPDIVFAAGPITRDVRIVGGNGGPGTWIRVEIPPGAHLDHIEITDFGGLKVAQEHAGYVRNSTFSRLLGYWPGPDIAWHGNEREPSFGNAFLGVSSITPQEGSSWHHPGDFWLVNADCESWNMNDHGQDACFLVDGAAHVFSAGLSGGTAFVNRAGALATMRDTGGLVSWFFHGTGGRRGEGDLDIQRVGSAVLLRRDPAARLFDDGPRFANARIDLPLGASGSVATLASAQGDAIAALLQSNPPPLNRSKPSLRAVADPAIASGDELTAMPDSSTMLQRRIDAEGVARLDGGVYYLDRPLRVGSVTRTEGLLGASTDAVVLVPKGDFAAIQGRGDVMTPVNAESVLVYLAFDRLTIVGGTVAFDWSAAKGNFGQGVTIAFSNFSHLRLLHQRVAAIRVNEIHGIDANSWLHDDFVDTPFAVLGYGHGTSGPMGYADKQGFIDCQFQRITQAVWSWSSDRPSGGELWQDSVFDQVAELSRTRSATGLLWANSVMHDVSGPIAIHVLDQGDTATGYFYQFDCLWQGRGPEVVTDSLSFKLGTLFLATRFEQSGGRIVADHGAQSLFTAYTTLPGTALTNGLDEAIVIAPDPLSSPRALTVIRAGKEVLHLDRDQRVADVLAKPKE